MEDNSYKFELKKFLLKIYFRDVLFPNETLVLLKLEKSQNKLLKKCLFPERLHTKYELFVTDGMITKRSRVSINEKEAVKHFLKIIYKSKSELQ